MLPVQSSFFRSHLLFAGPLFAQSSHVTALPHASSRAEAPAQWSLPDLLRCGNSPRKATGECQRLLQPTLLKKWFLSSVWAADEKAKPLSIFYLRVPPLGNN